MLLFIFKEPERISSEDEIDQETTNEGWYRPIGARYRSEVWKYFKLNNSKTKTKCDRCPTILVRAGGTSTMVKHLAAIHFINIENASRKRSSTGAAATAPPRVNVTSPTEPISAPQQASGLCQVPINIALTR